MPIVADQQLEDLTAITTAAGADELLINDVSDTTDDANGSPKKILARNALFGLDMSGSAETGNFTAVIGQLHPVEVLTTNTANYLVTFPGSPVAGDRFGFFVRRQNTTDSGAGPFAQAPFYCVEPTSTTLINKVSYPTNAADGSGRWGLWLDGELLIFRYVDSTLGWVVEYDGRIPHMACGYNTVDDTDFMVTANTFYKIELNASLVDVGGLLDTTNDLIDIKRIGEYTFHGALTLVQESPQPTRYTCRVADSGGTDVWGFQYGVEPAVAARMAVNCSGIGTVNTARREIILEGRSTVANQDVQGSTAAPLTSLSVSEIL